MADFSNKEPKIIRTEKGLTISGTRITLYDVIDFLKIEYPPKLIRDKFNLTEQQINAALLYIKANHSEVENEYQEVLDTRAEIYQYWKERNQKHLANIRKIPHKPEQEKLWQKLESQKARYTTNIL